MMTGLAEAKIALERGDYIDALTRLSAMLDDGRSASVLTLLGETFEKLDHPADALDLFCQAADLEPTPQSLLRALTAAFAAGDHQRTQLYGMKRLDLVPDDAETAWMLATAFIATGERELARNLWPILGRSDVPAHFLLGADLRPFVDPNPLALDMFGKVSALYPDNPFPQFVYMSIAREFCAYDILETLERRWEEDLHRGTPEILAGELPFGNLLYCGDERINRLARNTQVTRAPGNARDAKRKRRHVWGKRLRIGYLSNDFWSEHATMRLLRSVLDAHDRSRFDVTRYCHSDEAQIRADPADRSGWGRVVNLHAMDDAQAAATIQADGIDILVDLKGLTSNARCGILNFRPAPVQVAWLGFPGSTTDVDCDYVIGDHIVLPDRSAPFYHEHFCRLPETYQPNDPIHRALPPAARRADLGLPEDRIIFAAFNSQRKISFRTLDLWAAVLRHTPDAVLWVLVTGTVAQENFRAAMAGRGVTGDRIIFAAKAHYAAHIARLQAADLGLDTVPYNGHTTTSDQLWAGLPVLTLKGTNFASRVSESLLTAIGLPDLVMPDEDAFVARAGSLAADPEKIAALKRTLVDNRFRAPLFDSDRFCRHLEQGYAMMASRARKNLKPAAMDVPCLPPRTHPFKGVS